jgi:hypothetical protein
MPMKQGSGPDFVVLAEAQDGDEYEIGRTGSAREGEGVSFRPVGRPDTRGPDQLCADTEAGYYLILEPPVP